jgi:hypothetical protein
MYTQFETLRKLCSAYANLYHASLEVSAAMMTLGRDSAKTFLSNCPTHSLWFERFAKGCLRRIGQEGHQDKAISSGVMLELPDILEKDWLHKPNREAIALIGAYVYIAFGGSFHGHEVFMVDLYGLTKYSRGKLVADITSYLIIPLLGRIKMEDGEQYHLTPLVHTTQSGISISKWLDRLVLIKQQQGLKHGPAFSNRSGTHIDPV